MGGSESGPIKVPEFFRMMADHVPIAACVVSNYKLVYVNRTLADLVGYQPQNMIGRSPLEFIAPDDQSQAAKLMQELLEGQQDNLHTVVRLVHRDGREVYLEVFGRVLEWNGRKFIFNGGINVTDKIQLVETLQRNEQLLRSIFDSVPDAIVIVKPDGEITDWNKGAEQMFGYRREEIAGKKLRILMSPSSYSRFWAICTRAHESGDFSQLHHLQEAVCLRKDGSEFPVEMAFASWQSVTGLRLVGVIRDISERKESLRQWRQFIQELIRALSTVIQARTPYTAFHQLRVAELARAIARELDLPPDQVEGVYIGVLLHDIGKLAVPLEILSKPTGLSELERELVKQHTWRGYEILKQVDFPWPVAEVALQHHERLDGSGYPQGLKDGEIILEARIVAVADVVEAMASHRPYRPALGLIAALEEIETGKGVRYDPQAVDACLRLFREQGFRFQTDYEIWPTSGRSPAPA